MESCPGVQTTFQTPLLQEDQLWIDPSSEESSAPSDQAQSSADSTTLEISSVLNKAFSDKADYLIQNEKIFDPSQVGGFLKNYELKDIERALEDLDSIDYRELADNIRTFFSTIGANAGKITMDLPEPGYMENLIEAYLFMMMKPRNPWQAQQMVQNSALITALLVTGGVTTMGAGAALGAGVLGFLAAKLNLKVPEKVTSKLPKVDSSRIPASIFQVENLNLIAAHCPQERLTGRDDVTERIFHIWTSNTIDSRKHPLLVGDTGSGKSAIMRSLADRIVRGDVPTEMQSFFSDKVLFGGNAADLLPSDSNQKGTDKFEVILERLKPIKERAIFCVDEAAALLSRTDDQHKNLLKSVLDTSIKSLPYTLWAMTRQDFQDYVRATPLERRFEPIYLDYLQKTDVVHLLREIILIHYPSQQLDDDLLEYVFDETQSKLCAPFLGETQPQTACSILHGAISRIRSAQAEPKSKRRLIEKEKELQNAKMSTVFSGSTQRRPAIRVLQGEVDQLKMAVSQETFTLNKYHLANATYKKVKTKCVELAKKISKEPNNQAAAKAFIFYYCYIFPKILAKLNHPSTTLGVPLLDRNVIDSVIANRVETLQRAQQPSRQAQQQAQSSAQGEAPPEQRESSSSK